MDDRNDDDPSDNVIGPSDKKIMVDGLFGIPNEENDAINPSPSDEIQMEVEYDTKISYEKLSNSDTSKEPESPKSLAVVSENQGQLREENVSMNPILSVENKTSCDQKSEKDLNCKENDQNNSKLSEDENCIILKDGNTLNEKNDICSRMDADSNSFGSRVLCSNSTEPGNSEIQPSFALISENYEKSRKLISENQTNCEPTSESNTESVVVIPDGNLPSTLSLISANYQDSSSDDSDDSASVHYVADSDDENSIISILKDGPVKTRGELDISDLPPIEDLKITVEEEKCQPVGCIKNIVETLVIVEAFLNQPALDIDSVLFVDRGQRALGRIFDVFGPVNKPYYAVRFNDSEHIKKFDVHIKEPVYCAPQTEYASFVLVSQLLEMKGSDASWRHNNEPPTEFLDYSDDEAEKLAKKKRKKKKCADSEENGLPKSDKPNPPAQNTSKKNSQPSASTSNPSARNSNRPPNTYSPRPPNTYSPRPPNTYSTHPPNVYSPHPPNYSYGPRQFPTYAQHLSSMDYSHTYRQPYNPYYYNQMYPPRPSYPYQSHYRPPGYDYQSQAPMDPNNPNNQCHHPNYDYM